MNRTSPKPTSLPTYQPTNLTPRQAASRANGAKSKGPTTPEGKAKVSKNAIKHGLTSEDILLEDESQEEFEALRDSFYEDYKPRTALERVLFDRVVACAWKLQRIRGMERNLHAPLRKPESGEETPKPEIQVLIGHNPRATSGACPLDRLLKLNRYEAGIERSFYRAIKELEAQRKQRRILGHEGVIGEADLTVAGIVIPASPSRVTDAPSEEQNEPDKLPLDLDRRLRAEAARQNRSSAPYRKRLGHILAHTRAIRERTNLPFDQAFKFAEGISDEAYEKRRQRTSAPQP